MLVIFAFVFVSIPSVFAETYRGDTYQDTDNGNGSHTWIGGLSPWIETSDLDANGRIIYKHYLVSDQPTYVAVQNGEASFVFDKTTCSAKIYKGGLINDSNDFVIGSDSYVPKVSVDGSGVWNIVNSVNDASCVTEIIETTNSIQVSGTKTSSAGVFKVIYLKSDGRPLKTILEATNLTSLTDRRFGVTQTQSIPQIITFGGQQRDLANHVGQTFDRTWLENNKADLFEFSQGLKFDVIDAWDKLDSISVNSVSNGVANISFNYLRNTPILLPNETLVIDPTYSSNNPTEDSYILDDDNDNACENTGGTYTETSGTANLYVSTPTAASAYDCIRTFIEWDISSIPDASIVSDTVFKFDVDLVAGSGRNCDVNDLEKQPSISSAATIFADIANGTNFITNNNACTTTGNNKSLDLGANGDQEIENNLSVNWFGIGIKYNNEVQDGTNHDTDIASEEDAGATPKPTLEVTYTTPTAPDAVEDLTYTSLGVSSVDLDWTAPDDGGGNQQIIGYQINMTTPWTNNPLVHINDTGTTDTDYLITSLIYDTNYSFRVSAWTNNTGGHPFNNATGNILNVTTLTLPQVETVNEIITVIGDTARFTGFVNVTSGGTQSNLTSIRIILNGTTINTNSTIQNSTGTPYGVNIGPFWIRMITDDIYEFEVETTLQNTTDNIVNSTLFYDSREYGPSYFDAVDNPSIQGQVNYTISRFDSEDGIWLKVNRIDVSTGSTWQIECISQTNSEASQTKNETQTWEGTWNNATTTGYFNTTWTGFANSHAYITCFNDDELFTLTDFTDSSLALLGIELFDQSYGSMLGVPVGIFFLVMTAGMANKRTAPTFIIVITGIAGTMATIGFFSFEPIVWGLALVTAMLGIFVNQKIF